MLDFIRSSGVGVVVRDLLRPPADLLAQVEAAAEALRSHNNRAVFEVTELLLERMAAPQGVPQGDGANAPLLAASPGQPPTKGNIA